MITVHNEGVFLRAGVPCSSAPVSPEEGRQETMAYRILQSHNTSGAPDHLKIRFDALISHDITYVGIIQQARASGMKAFPVPSPPPRSTAASTCPPTSPSSTPMPGSRWPAAAK